MQRGKSYTGFGYQKKLYFSFSLVLTKEYGQWLAIWPNGRQSKLNEWWVCTGKCYNELLTFKYSFCCQNSSLCSVELYIWSSLFLSIWYIFFEKGILPKHASKLENNLRGTCSKIHLPKILPSIFI